MSKSDYKNMILKMLGGSVVDVELDSDVDTFVDIALMEIKPFIGTTQYLTLPYQPIIDLSSRKVYNIVSVYRGSALSNLSTTGLTDEALLFGTGSYNLAGNSYAQLFNLSYSDQLAIRLLTQQVVNTASALTDIDFTYKDGKLYLETLNGNCSDITLEYNPLYESVDEVTDPYWVSVIYRMALANTKIALGRARGKYRVSNLSYELDSDTILNEGISELEQLRTELKDSNDTFYLLD